MRRLQQHDIGYGVIRLDFNVDDLAGERQFGDFHPGYGLLCNRQRQHPTTGEERHHLVMVILLALLVGKDHPLLSGKNVSWR